MTSIDSEAWEQTPQQDLTHQAPSLLKQGELETVPGALSGDGQLPLSAWRLTSNQRHWALWVHGLAHWGVMLTVTLKRRDGQGRATTRQAVVSALRHFVRLINFRCFGPGRVRHGWTIGIAPVIVADTSAAHLHAHVLLTKPTGRTDKWYRTVIERAARRTRLFDQQRRVSDYRDAGGSAYLVKHGVIRMDPSLIVLPHPH